MTLTGTVEAVRDQRIWRQPSWGMARIPKGTRYTVFVRREGAAVWSERPYTTDALMASLCLRAKETGRVITLETRDTRWGEEITHAQLHDTEVNYV